LGEWNQYIEIGWTVKPAIYNLEFGLIKPILYILDPAVTSSNFNVNIYRIYIWFLFLALVVVHLLRSASSISPFDQPIFLVLLTC
jgi:hypothetical protein